MSDILDLPPPAPGHFIRYGPQRSQFGELRLPEQATGGVPVVVVVHGGLWRAQYSLDHIGHLCAALTREGWATWSIEYRRLGEPGGGWPGTFADAGAALDAVRGLAGEWPLDAARVVTIGHSAGGHLELWLAARHQLADHAELGAAEPLRPLGAVALAAVSDLSLAARLGLSGDVAAQLLGGPPDRHPERYAAGSPAELLPLGARSILVHGEDDQIVPISMSRQFWQRATEAGDASELVALAGAGHFEVIDPRSWVYPSVRDAVARVLDEAPPSGSSGSGAGIG